MSTKKERILRKLNPTLLKMTPTLSGDAGSFIDLDSEDSLEEGAKRLMMRFLKNRDIYVKNGLNRQELKTEVTISSAKYNENEEICELITERLSLPFVRNDQNDSEKPGKRLQKLKMELQEKMSAKWEEEYKKRVGENKSFVKKHKTRKQKSHGHSSSGSEVDDKEDIAERCDEVELSEDQDDEDQDDVDNDNGENESDGVFGCQDEQSEKSCNPENNKDRAFEKDIEDDDSEACSLVPPYQPGGGLLYGGSELTQGDEGLPQNLLSPSLRLSMNESPGSKFSESFNERTPKKPEYMPSEDDDSLFAGKKKLFSPNPRNSFDLSDAFEFCSGKFPDADNSEMQNLSKGKLNANYYEKVNEVDNEEGNEGDDEEENENDDEGDKFEGGDEEDDNVEVQNSTEEVDSESEFPKDNQRIRKNIVAFEDSEEEEEAEKETDEKQVIPVEDVHAKALELLSEDEDEAAIRNVTKGHKKTRKSLYFSDEEDTGNDCEDEVDDSDDSESEKADDGKEDCDERSIHYDSEENEIINPKEFFEKEAEISGSEWSGDEDERGLDEFDVEEGDADNIDSSQVRSQLEKIHIRRVLDDDAREVRLIQEILFEDGDLHSDGKRRDRKFKWKNLGTFEEQLNDEEAKEDGGHSSDDCAEEENLRRLRYEKELFFTAKKGEDASSDEEIAADIQMVKVMRVKACESGRSNADKSKVVTDSVEVAKNLLLSRTRGSFLARNEEFLSRLAKVTSSLTENVLGPQHSRNFIFASKSPDKNAVCKRQVEEREDCGRSEKRMKVLPPEVDTGPSILELLV